MTRNILVTGACGKIGDAICSNLLKKEFHVIGLDYQLSDHNSKNDNFTFISTENGIQSALEQAFKKFTIHTVIHASCTADNDFNNIITDNEMKISKEYDDIIYTMASENKVFQFILISTNQVYAKVKTREPLREWDSVTKPVTNYGKLKIDAERGLAKESKSNTNMICAILRIPQIYSFNFYDNLISKIEDPKDGSYFIYRKGDYGFQFCCIHNLVDFISCFVQQANNKSFTNIYNVCDNSLITASDIIKFMKENYKMGVVLQRPEPKENPIKFITSKIISNEEKTNYRYLDFNFILNCIMLDNKKANEICPARWTLQNMPKDI